MARLPRVAERKSSLADEAYNAIKKRIIRCELEPGTYVTEGQLVREIGIGKTPVREALSRLAQDELVRNIPRHGYQVAPITIGDVQELFRLRLIVEPAAVQLAVGHVDAVQLRRLDELCQAGYVPGDHESVDQFLGANHELHTTIARAAGNRRLAAIVVRLLEESDRFFHLALMLTNRSSEMSHEHIELVDALVAADTEAARRIAIEQIIAAQRMVMDALLASPSILSAEVTPPPAGVRPLPRAGRKGGRSGTRRMPASA